MLRIVQRVSAVPVAAVFAVNAYLVGGGLLRWLWGAMALVWLMDLPASFISGRKVFIAWQLIKVGALIACFLVVLDYLGRTLLASML